MCTVRKHFDLDKVILLNISVLREEQLLAFAKFYKIYFDILMYYKNHGVSYLWVYVKVDVSEIIAIGEKYQFEFLNEYGGLTMKEYKKFNAIKISKTPKMYNSKPTLLAPPPNLEESLDKMESKTSNPLKKQFSKGNNSHYKNTQARANRYTPILELNTILDRISLIGIDNITKQEKNFLNNLSKK